MRTQRYITSALAVSAGASGLPAPLPPLLCASCVWWVSGAGAVMCLPALPASQPYLDPLLPPPAAEPLQVDNPLAGLRVINTANEGSVSGPPLGTSGRPGGPQLTARVPNPRRPSKLLVGLTLGGERQVGRNAAAVCCCLLLSAAAAAAAACVPNLPPIPLPLSSAFPPSLLLPPCPCSCRVALTGLSLQARVATQLSARATLMTGPSSVGVRPAPPGMVVVPRGRGTQMSVACRPTTWDCGWYLASLSTPSTPR